MMFSHCSLDTSLRYTVWRAFFRCGSMFRHNLRLSLRVASPFLMGSQYFAKWSRACRVEKQNISIFYNKIITAKWHSRNPGQRLLECSVVQGNMRAQYCKFAEQSRGPKFSFQFALLSPYLMLVILKCCPNNLDQDCSFHQQTINFVGGTKVCRLILGQTDAHILAQHCLPLYFLE